ncbi:MAG TPA: type VII secretion protein EccB [Pseudonocardiaceae bacterium]|nr:type VII secretion protein EccB [Pseudonocardiaceae bacterium]
MASTPTTKSQVQAYRFVIRRMESALVRKDPVMLHDPMRSHKRATVVSVILGAVGLIGFAIFGLFSPSSSVPASGIVIGAQSGQVYVVSQDPYQLIPVFNVASARLLLMVEANHGAPIVPSPNGQSATLPQIAAPSTVNDDQLTSIPMGRLTGIPDGPQELPAPGTGTSDWAVCDQINQPAAVGGTGPVQPTTTVLAGMTNIGQNLGPDEGLLVQAPNNNQEYLIYDKQSNANNAEDDSAVAAPIDATDSHIVNAFHLQNIQPRLISAALLGAIPQVAEIKNPVAPYSGQGQPSGYSLPDNIQVGQSFAVQNSSGPDSYFVALPDGLQSVTSTVAQIVQYEQHGQINFPRVADTQIANIKVVKELDVDSYPVNVPGTIVDSSLHPVTCLGWSADTSNPLKPLVRTRVTVDVKLELPSNPNNPSSTMLPVPVGQPGPSGEKIDSFFMNPGHQSLAVHAATNPAEFKAGPIYIVSGRGVKYSVADLTTAQGLGIANSGGTSDGLAAAPESILSLLPSSAQTLSTENVMHTYDAVPVQQNAGYYITPSSQQNAPSGG